MWVPIVAVMLAGVGGGCGGGDDEAAAVVTIAAPGRSAQLLTQGAGSGFTYYAPEELAPQSWEDVSQGSLWLCSQDDRTGRPPLLPDGIVGMLNGGGFSPGTVIGLTWTDQPGAPDSSEIGIAQMYATVGITYEGCTEGALERIRESGVTGLLLTDGSFEGQDDTVVVDFE